MPTTKAALCTGQLSGAAEIYIGALASQMLAELSDNYAASANIDDRKSAAYSSLENEALDHFDGFSRSF